MIGKEILGYHVDEKIGSGGFGTVYKVSKTNVSGTYTRALKHITLPTKKQYASVLNSMGGDYAKADDYFAGALKDIINEIKILSSLSESGVRNIVRYYENDIVETPSPKTYDIYIMMEYLTPFTDYLENNDFTVQNIIGLGKDILNALVSCHGKNIIHRDIKDDNIFVSEDGVYKLGDFGVSKALKDKSRAESVKGTPNFIAPEVYLGKETYDNTVDLYSLGIVLYKLLNKMRAPFLPPFPAPYNTSDEDAAFEARMTGKIPELPIAAQNELGRVILKAIMPRAERYNSAKEFLSALEAVEAQMSGEELSTVACKAVVALSATKTVVVSHQTGNVTSNDTLGAPYTTEGEEQEKAESRQLFETFSAPRQAPAAETSKPSKTSKKAARTESVKEEKEMYTPKATPEPKYAANEDFAKPDISEKSKKMMTMYSIAWVVCFAVFNLIAFVIPEKIGGGQKFDGAFWVSYLFITLAFVGQFACSLLALKEGDLKKLFYKMPLIVISYGGLVTMLIVGGLFIAVAGLPGWLGAVVCAIILAVNVVSVLKASVAADVVSEIDEKVKVQTFTIKSLTIDAQSLMTTAKTNELRAEAKQVYEALRYSDPMSTPMLADLDNRLQVVFGVFENAVNDNDLDQAIQSREELTAVVKKRNQKCKLLK